MQHDNSSQSNCTIIFNFLDMLQNILSKIGYDVSISNLFYWFKENNEVIGNTVLKLDPEGGPVVKESKITLEQNYNRFIFNLSKLLLSLVSLKTKLNMLYNWKLIHQVSECLFKNIRIEQVPSLTKVPKEEEEGEIQTTTTSTCTGQNIQSNIRITYKEYELMSDLSNIDDFSSINCKGLYTTTSVSLQLSVLLVNTFYQISRKDNEPFQSFLKKYPISQYTSSIISLDNLNINITYSPTKDSFSNNNSLINSPSGINNNPIFNLKSLSPISSNVVSPTPPHSQSNIYIPPVIKLQDNSLFSIEDVDTVYEVMASFYDCLKNSLKTDMVLDSRYQYDYYYSKDTISLKEEGSFIFNSSIGPIQIGIPPETIKTSLKKNELVPQVYVLPHTLSSRGVSYSEVEFPIFFNFFIKKAACNPNFRVIMIGEAEQLERVKDIFKESMFGPEPEQIYIREELSREKIEEGYDIDFFAERSTLAFKKGSQEATIDDYMITKPYDANNQVLLDLPSILESNTIKQVKIINRHGFVSFYEDNKLRGVVDSTVDPKSPPLLNFNSPMVNSSTIHGYKKKTSTSGQYTPVFTSTSLHGPSNLSLDDLKEYSNSDEHTANQSLTFDPPTLGITFLGVGHGFAINDSTTGFIIWLNGNGILVDPPVGTTYYLQKHGLFGKTVDKVILTHCHSDHDSGILQKIIESNKITLYTTKTINESYQRKVRALTGIKNIQDYYHWIPVKIGEPLDIEGATFTFDYSYHTIPTIRFKLKAYNKTISYSSDTKYCPQSLRKLYEDGVINEKRESSLRMFVFDADYIIHECGIPPIHTSVENLNDLPDSVKEKLLVVHTSAIPDKITKINPLTGQTTQVPVKGIKIPKVGLTNTIRIPVGDYYEGYALALRKFQLICDSFYFRNTPPSMLYKLVHLLDHERLEANNMVIKTGEPCDKCYIIDYGSADVYIPSSTLLKPNPDNNTKDRSNEHLTWVGNFYSGETFGENALLKDKIRLATVVSKTEMDIYSIKSSNFLRLQSHQIRHDELTNSITQDLDKISKYGNFISNIMQKTFPFNLLNFTKEIIDHIASTIESTLTLEAGSIIIKQGDHDQSLFIIEDGTVNLLKNDKAFKTLGKGDCFGEISLILGLPRTCTAISSSKTTLIIINYDSFQRILDKFQNLKYNLVQLVEQRLTQGFSLENNNRE